METPVRDRFVVKWRKISKRIFNPKNRTFKIQDIRRIFAEAIEIIFNFQNNKAQVFGPAKLTHFLDQIIPTAYIYNTAYWIFYKFSEMSTLHICFCNDYGCGCIHLYNEILGAWLKDCDIEEEQTFVPEFVGDVIPNVVKFLSCVHNNYMDIYMRFYVSTKNGDTFMNYSLVHLILRYNICEEVNKKETETFLIFDPSPILHRGYGTFMGDILLKMYDYYLKDIVVSLDSNYFTLQRAHSYIFTVPGVHFNIDLPPSVSSTCNSPLTQLDYEMIADICESLIAACNDLDIIGIISDILNRCNEEFALVKSTKLDIDDAFIHTERHYLTLHWVG